MEADGHSQLFDRVPERLERGIVHVTAVDRVRVADDGDGAELAHRAPGFRDGARHVVERDLRGEPQPFRRELAVIGGPVVVRAGERRGDVRRQLVVHQHLPAPRAIEDADVDAFDVHGLHVRLRVVGPRVRGLVMRMPLERPVLEIAADHGRVRTLRHLGYLDLPDLDDRLVRRARGAADELRREALERLVEITLPEAVRLHRVQIAVEDAVSLFHVCLTRTC